MANNTTGIPPAAPMGGASDTGLLPSNLENSVPVWEVAPDTSLGAPTADKVAATGTQPARNAYLQALNILLGSTDLGLDNIAREEIQKAQASGRPAQLICRDLLDRKLLNPQMLGRALARANHVSEVISFHEIPSGAGALRESLPPKAAALLRQERMIPLTVKRNERNEVTELHLAAETMGRDLVLESQLRESLLPTTQFVWHFGLREVAGAYWLSGASTDVDAGMEAEALLERILSTAIDARASDIHIDPSIKGEPRALIKYRIDGFVHPKEMITSEQLDRLRVRIENVARMAKVNLSHPNKGAFTRVGYDWRVQIQPHAGRQGPVPRIVIRRLKPEVLPLEALGYPQDFIEKILVAGAMPNGVVFWTGPTGSGKTESIHAALVSSNPMARGLSVHTIEDPPEKRVPGYAVQMEVAEEDPARTALQLLKSSLRADPDVIIFGEVRDKEMARLVFEAANTGHLVFSTLHTNTALDSVFRLVELGIEGFLLSYVRGIAAQRLVRRLCSHCKVRQEQPDDFVRYIFDRYQLPIEGADIHTASAEGCLNCNFTGYYGRIAVAEWLRPSKELIEATAKGEYEQIEDMARRAGWQPMGRMGAQHIAAGITDANELASKILELSTAMMGK
ncbi:MAG TPA: ATPase, T2SS/T4P/T4SS family [Alphaproteobacteria bacterium]|nr:ATPase, T2SS/T4P/T4SS family [Alphaproteobacteria bacterium]